MPLIDYITTIGNFTPNYITSGLYPSGYFDMWNVGEAEINATAEIKALIAENRASVADNSDPNVTVYEFLLKPATGFLNCPTPLLPGSELKLSFDRAKAELALINISSNDVHSGTVLALSNLHLKAKYCSSPYLRNVFAGIEESELRYRFDECSCYLKNLPTGESTIRLSNVIGGLAPKYIFCGIIESESLAGSFKLSSTRFQRHGVKEFNLTLNGFSCNDYPIICTNGSALPVYKKWLQSTNRFFNNTCGGQITPMDFKRFHYVYSHKFEGEQTEQGWLGIDLKLETAYTSNYTMGKKLILFRLA